MFKKSFKYRIYPTKRQEKLLQASLDACKFVYNKTLELRKNSWESSKKSLSFYDTANMLPQMKKDYPFLNYAHSQCLQEAQHRVDRAFKAFFQRCKRGEKPGYPRFKGRDRYNSFTYPQSGFKILEGALKLAKIGFLKIKLHRSLEGTVKTLAIRKEGNKWYACFSCEVESAPLPELDATVGIDLGLESFATLSTGEKIPNPRFFKTSQHRLAKAQRRLSKAQKGTSERNRLKKIVVHIHAQIANKRKDFAHKISLYLVQNFQTIVFEDLNIKQMQEGAFKGIRKSIGDIAWNQLVQFTSYKAAYAGRNVILVDPRNTSKMCSHCGQLVPKGLSERVHSCTCGLVIDRDHNASLNILTLGMQSLDSGLRSPHL